MDTGKKFGVGVAASVGAVLGGGLAFSASKLMDAAMEQAAPIRRYFAFDISIFILDSLKNNRLVPSIYACCL
jgi:hypothetical protein